MKTLFTFALCLLAVVAQAANPSTKSFRAAGGLVVTSNDITGIITYDGSGISSPTGGVSAATVTNIVLGNGTKIAPGSNVTVATNVTASNIVYTVSSTTPGGGSTNLGVGESVFLDAAFGNDATAQRTNMARPFIGASNAVYAMAAGDTLVVRGGDYPVHPLADSYDASLLISNKNDIAIRGEPDSVFALSSLRGDEFGFYGSMMKLSRCTNVIIDGLTFRGLRTNALVEQHFAIQLDQCKGVKIRNCKFYDWQNQAITCLSLFTTGEDYEVSKCDFYDIGGTNTATLVTDGAAISLHATNTLIDGNLFVRCLREAEVCCSALVRGFTFVNNVSVGNYFQCLVLESAGIQDVVIANNYAYGYSTTLPQYPNVVNEARFIITWGMSNAVIRDNYVFGMSPFAWVANQGVDLLDVQFLDNTFKDSVYSSGLYAIRIVGQNTFNRRMTIKGNTFINHFQNAIRYGGSDGLIEGNRFIDCNGIVDTTGVLCIGSRFASENTNVVNTRIINNQFEAATAVALTTGIVVYASSATNSIWGNEISRNIQGAIMDLGVGTLTMPVNVLASGAMLYSDTNSRLARVTMGSGVAFNPTTGILTGTGGGGASTNYAFHEDQFTLGDGTNVAIKAGGIFPFIDVGNGLVYGSPVDYGLYYDGGIDTLYYQDQRFAPNYTNIFGISNGFANFFVSPVLNDLPTGSLLRTTSAKRISAVTIGANLTWDGTTLAATGGGGGAFGSDGWVQYANSGTNKAEAAFNYNDGDDTLTVTTLLAQTIGILPNARSGNVLTGNESGIGTWRSNITISGSITASNGLYAAGPGAGLVGFGTNFTMVGAVSSNASYLITPTNAAPGIMVALPVVPGVSNQWVNVPLGNAQYLTYNGTAYVPSNLPGSLPSAMTQTNFVLNQVYTNSSTASILVRAVTFKVTALANGDAAVDLMYSKTGGTNYTIIGRDAIATLLTGGFSLPITNEITGVITNFGSYYFTNTSSGAGNSAGLVDGTGQFTTIGVGPVGPAGPGALQANTNSWLPLVAQTNLANTVYEAFPQSDLDTNGDFVVVYRKAVVHINTNSALWISRTSNKGLTWSTPTLMFTNAGWDVGLFAFGIEAIHGRAPGRYHLIIGLREVLTGNYSNLVAYYSDSDGSSWTAGGTVPPPFAEFDQGVAFGRIITLDSGNLASTYYSGTNAIKNAVWFMKNTNSGISSWTTNMMTSTLTAGFKETQLVNMGGSNILALVRVEDAGASSTNVLRQVCSDDEGATWNAGSFGYVSLGLSALVGRNPPGIYSYDSQDGRRLVLVWGNRAAGALTVREVSARRAWWDFSEWSKVPTTEAFARGAIGTMAGGYASPIGTGLSSECIVSYYYENSTSSAQIRFLTRSKP